MLRSRRPVRSTRHSLNLRNRLWLQPLEERTVPANLVVLNSNDSGADSLRAVMATADTNGQDDTITFAAGVTAINLTSGQISLTTQNNLLTIDGGGVVTINGAATASATNRIFSFNVSGGNPTITLKDLTLANGNLSGTNNGGAILLNNDPLALSNVTFSNNKTAGGGGAIATTSSVAETITITNGSFTGNSAGTAGGSIFALGNLNLNINGTSVSNNTATTTGGFIQTNGTSTVTINAATFTSNTAAGVGTGAAVIQNGGTSSVFNLTSSTFTLNQASAGAAGAINSTASSVTFNATNCSFTNNFAGNGPGGALRLGGGSTSVTIDSCVVTGNSANSSGTGGTGGGISFYPLSGVGSLSITNSTISGNSSAGNGGGVYIRLAGANSAVITNSTISGNIVTSSNSDGGGVAITAGNLTINNSTIFGNSAGSNGAGGGIRKLQAGGLGALTLNSSIIAGNTASGISSDVSSSATVPFTVGGGHNVIGVADVGGFTLAGANRTGTFATPLDAKLNGLANNGGPTPTHSLQPDSPAINFGTNVGSLTNDQRGAGFPRVNNAIPDAGAVESTTLIPGAKATMPAVTPAGTTYSVTVAYTDETAIDTSSIDTGDVKLSGPGYVGSVAPTSASFAGSGKSVTATYTFAAPGGSWDWTDDGTYTLVMQSSQVSDTDGPNSVPGGVLEVVSVAISLPNPLVVDNSSDTDDGNVAANQLTLREAVRLANLTVGQADSITFAAGLSGQTITLGSQNFITDPVTITGLGAANLTLSGGDAKRIFGVNLANGTDTVTISQLTISHGNATAGMGGAITVDSGNLSMSSVTLDSNKSTVSTLAGGGAIFFNTAAKLTLNNCTIINNADLASVSASNGGGGAINCPGAATVTLNNCVVDNNTSSLDSGGFIRSTAAGFSLTINDSTITNNSGGFGGFAYIGAGSTITLARDTFSGNSSTSSSALTGGGVIYYFSTGASTLSADSCLFTNNAAKVGGVLGMSGGSSTFINCTLDGNIATGTGGGAISMNVAGATLTLNNCTVTGNNASIGAGGGILKNFTSTSVTINLNSSIVAGNFAAIRGQDMDFGATTITATTINGGKNLVGISDVGNFVLSGANKTGTNALPLDPLLNVLANNGGPTQTRSLKPGSPAFDSGSNVLSLSFDQRGTGFPRSLQTGVDVGAFEGVNPVPTYNGTLANVPPINATYKTSVTYTSPVGINTGSIDINDVRLSGPGYGMTPATPTSAVVTAGTNGSKSVTVEYTFTPPGGSWDYTDDGAYALSVQDNQVYDTNVTPQAAVGGQVNTMLVAIPLPVMVVDNADDFDDGDYSAGNFTLREAINRANAAVGTSDTITFAQALVGGQFITISSELDITDPLTIIGPGANNLTISGGGATKIFATSIPTVNSPVSISGLTIQDGYAPGGSAMVIAAEAVTFNNCVFNNNANSAAAGALYLIGAGVGSLTVNNCVFDDNYSTAGGAITVQAGGGLFVNNCLFTNNYSTLGSSGGAIRYIGTSTSTNAAIRNSTFTGNHTLFSGGAIGFASISAPVSVQNCTITGNIANYGDATVGVGTGGGIAIFGATGTGKVILDSCIVSGNVQGVASPVADDLSNVGGEFDANFCLIGAPAAGTTLVSDSKTASLLGQNPMLDVLANNGGPTQTFALLPGSPAINNGSNPANLSYDQRGAYYGRKAGAGVDIGAYEMQLPSKVTNVLINDGSIQRSRVTSLTVTFSEPPLLPANVASAFHLIRQSDLAVVGLNATVSGNSVTLTFTSGPLDFGSLADGRYTLSISAASVSNLDGDGNGVAGDDYTLVGNPANAPKLFRLYGDVDGNGLVDGVDFGAFRTAFNSNSFAFDYDGSGIVDGLDFGQFRSRFGMVI